MKQINFNKDWTFEKESSESKLKAFYGMNNAIKVDLPYDAMIREKRDKEAPAGAQSGFYQGGKYVYEKKFTLEKEWKDNDILIEFEGIYGISTVWVNGFLERKNQNGYVGFTINLTGLLFYEGENIIKVEVDNSRQPNSRWYTGTGIYRDVNLWIGNCVYVKNNATKITTKYLSDDMAQLEMTSIIKRSCNNMVMATCTFEVLEQGKIISSERQEISMISNEEKVHMYISVEQPLKWSVENPFLYECKITVFMNDECMDCQSIDFGIRTVVITSKNGVLINGKNVKLRGTCIHHDNGIIGAETFVEAEDYRCRKIKEAGFNAIRSSHNPMGKTMLDACDRYGILVMDELSDVWDRHKNTYDFADVFHEEAEDWIRYMVEKDYNHPSVIMYCVGNEISEAGTKQGAYVNRKLCNLFHELDQTRYTLNALNALNCAGARLKVIMKEMTEKFDSTQSSGGNNQGSNALNTFMSMMYGEKGDYFAKHPLVSEALEECNQSCDIIGLNYLSGRYELEKECHPNKAVLGTETYPADIFHLWNWVKNNNHVIGDFTWTGYDYIGEAGVGIFHYDGKENFTSIYPERLAYIGDIDLIGNRRPISFYREIVYGLRKTPYVAVERMNRNGKEPTKTAWMFKDNISSWTWTGFENETANIDVYSASDSVELFLNGVSLGREDAGEKNQYIASFCVEYEPGELKAVGYTNGLVDGEYVLKTAGPVRKICAEKVTENEKNLIYVKAVLTDDEGRHNYFEDKKVAVQLDENLVLEGYGTANPASEEDYFSNQVNSYDGYVMLAVRVLDKHKNAKIVFLADGIENAEIKIGEWDKE